MLLHDLKWPTGLRGHQAGIASLVISLLAVSPQAADARVSAPVATSVNLYTGRATVVNVPGTIQRVALSDPKVADIKVLSTHQLLLQGLKPGATSLLVWAGADHPTVHEVVCEPDTRRLQANLDRLNRPGQVQVAFNGHGLTLTGRARSQTTLEASEKMSQALGYPVLNLLTTHVDGEQIRMDLHVLELATEHTRNLGLSVGRTDSGPTVSSTTVRAGEWGTAFGLPAGPQVFDSLAARIDFLEREGVAKVLANPSLVSTDGGEAKFLAGGEMPIPVQQGLGQTTILWKEYGVRLACKPRIQPDGRIWLGVHPEVSSIDFSQGIAQGGLKVPALRTRKADTDVILAPGETMVLCGLLEKEETRQGDQPVGLAQVPIIGALFQSRRYLEKGSELAIMITPHLIRPSAQEPAAIKRLRTSEIDKVKP